MTLQDKIIAVHTAVTDAVSHGGRLKSDRYFVWQEDGSADLIADNCHAESGMCGTTDLFTKKEFDPWAGDFARSLDSCPDIAWYLNSVQFEPETGFWHYEWRWEVC